MGSYGPPKKNNSFFTYINNFICVWILWNCPWRTLVENLWPKWKDFWSLCGLVCDFVATSLSSALQRWPARGGVKVCPMGFLNSLGRTWFWRFWDVLPFLRILMESLIYDLFSLSSSFLYFLHLSGHTLPLFVGKDFTVCRRFSYF